MPRIGIDLGGTKIEGVVLGPDGAELARRRMATPRDYGASLAAIGALVEELAPFAPRGAPVGVGIPGTVSPTTGLVRNANSTWLNGQRLHHDLAQCLARPVRLANDANCFALSEAHDGAAAGANSVFGVILGTGVGGGIVLDGRVVDGASGIAGEWGHLPLPAPAADELGVSACWCGRNGCIETWLSGPGLAADHVRVALRSTTGSPSGDGDRGRAGSLQAEEIARRAAAGEPACIATLDRWFDRLGRALAVVVNVLDPEVVVLGGGLSNIADVAARCSETLAPHVFTDGVAVRVVRHLHGDSSGVRGAARLWSEAEAAAVSHG